MVEVSWYDALAYANWMSERKKVRPVFLLDIPKDPNELYNKEYSLRWQEVVDWQVLE